MDYDYETAVREDIESYLHGIRAGEYTQPTDRDDLYDTLFTEDSVTGNASGSYWCNAYKAKECVFGDSNAEDYIRELINEFGLSADEIANHFMDWEYWDVCIRIYLLGQVLDDVLDDLAWEF